MQLIDKRQESFLIKTSSLSTQDEAAALGRRRKAKVEEIPVWSLNTNQGKKRFLDGDFLAKVGFYIDQKSQKLLCCACGFDCTEWNQDHLHPISFHLESEPCYSVKLWALSCSLDDKKGPLVLKNVVVPDLGHNDISQLLLESYQDWPGSKKSKKPSAKKVHLFTSRDLTWG